MLEVCSHKLKKKKLHKKAQAVTFESGQAVSLFSKSDIRALPVSNLSAAPLCMVAFQRVGGSSGWLDLNSVQIRYFSNRAVKQTGRNS